MVFETGDCHVITQTIVTMTVAWKDRYVIPQDPVISMFDLVREVRREFSELDVCGLKSKG